MKLKGMMSKYSRCLLITMFLFAMIVISSQAAYAYNMRINMNVTPANVYVNSTMQVNIFVYDGDHSDWKLSHADGTIQINGPSGPKSLYFITDNDGLCSVNYTPTVAGNYALSATSSYDYKKAFNYDIGIQTAVSTPLSLTVSQKTYVIPKVSLGYIPSLSPTPLPTATLPPAPTATAEPSTSSSGNTPASTTDTEAPVTSLNVAGTVNGNGEYTSDVTCNLTAVDNSSGVNAIQYSFDGNSWYTYVKPFSVVNKGMTTVYYRSTDNAGNTEVAKVKAIVVSASAQSASSAAESTAKATPWQSALITALTVMTIAAMLIVRQANKK